MLVADLYEVHVFIYVVCFDETNVLKSSLVYLTEATSKFQGCLPSWLYVNNIFTYWEY